MNSIGYGTRQCLTCGAMFNPKYAAQVCCSEECKKHRKSFRDAARKATERRLAKRAEKRIEALKRAVKRVADRVGKQPAQEPQKIPPRGRKLKRQCVLCKSSFVASNPDQSTCPACLARYTRPVRNTCDLSDTGLM